MLPESDDAEPGAGLALAETVAPSEPPSSDAAVTIALRTVDPADYAVGEEIARGGMGRIRRAQDLRLGRPVAVKELLATAPEMVTRFEREIRLTARLQHPSIVSVYEAGRWPSGEPFFAMRVVPGKSLDQVVAPKKKLAERLALVPNVIAVVEALAYAHDQRIIHRDLKPGNVLIGPFGETVVIDWGLGKDLASGDDSVPPPTRAERPSAKTVEPPKSESSQGEHLTTAGSVMGTLAYMPPEQAAGDSVDERADVYALCAMLYHVLAGRPPFVGRGHDDLMVKVLSKSPAKLAGIDEDIPPDLIAIVEKAMAREAKDRYPSAGELAEDLRRFHTGQLVRAHDYSWWALVRRWVKQNRGAVTVGAAAVVALAVIATVLVRNIVVQRDRAEDATKRANEQRAVAVSAKDQAEVAAARLHFDQGRQELLAGNPLEAAVLGRAALAGEDTPATRLVIGQALETLEPLIRRFDGLAEEVVSTGFMPDGAHVFAATWNGKIRVWNVATGAVTSGFERPGRLLEAGLTRDGTTLVMLSDESVIELWDIASGTKLRAITVEGGVAERVAMSPDEKRLAVGGDGVSIWDPATGAKIATIAGVAEEAISEMNWTSEGGSLIVGDNDGNVAIIDTATWRPRMKTTVGEHAINDCSLSSDGKRLACVWRDGGAVLDAHSGAVQVAMDAPGQGRQASYRAVEWSNGGAVLSISTAGTDARLIDSQTGHTQAVFATAAVAMFGPDEEVLTFGPTAAHVAIWDKDGRRLVDEIAGHGRPITLAAISPDTHALLTASDDGTLSAWRLQASSATTRMTLTQPAHVLQLVAADSLLIAANHDGTADIFNMKSGERVRVIGEHVDGIYDPIIEIIGNRLLAVLGPHDVVELYDPTTGTLEHSFMPGGTVMRAGAVANGSVIWAATSTALNVWDATTGTARGTFLHAELANDPPTELVRPHASATVTSDGAMALVPAEKGLALIDIGSKREIATLPITGDIWSVVTNGDRAVVISYGAASLFDLTTHARIGSLVAQGESVVDVRFVAGALYTQGSDGVLRRWDPRTGALAASFDAESEAVLRFAVQPGGALLATYADDRIGIWDARTGKLLVQRSALIQANSTMAVLAFGAHDVVASSISSVRWTWHLPSWTSTVEQLDKRLACEVPWQLVDGALAPRVLDASCYARKR
ncbi:hypothetical protein BH11MYX2_BH11MYX2_13890 [soil metagenome]